MTNPYDGDELAALNRALLSRRGFLRAAGIGGAAVVGSGVLAACGAKAKNPRPQAGASSAKASSVPQNPTVLNFSNWPLYIDQDEKNKNKRPTLERFEKATGIKVRYTEDINDNDEFFGKIQPMLKAGQPIGRDIVVLTDWMAARMIRLGYVQEIDKSNIPNEKNLSPTLQNVPFDPDRKYTLPWQSGLTGIGYNPKKLGRELKTVSDIFDKRLKGRVTMLTEMRDTMGLMLLAMGKNPADHTMADYQAAIAKLQQLVDDKQIRQFTGNEYAADLAAGNIAAAFAWSGDVVQLQADDPDITYLIPDEGALIWSDNLMIPVSATNKAGAEKLFNYYYDPANAAEVAAYVNYVTPVAGAQQEMAKLDPELAKDPLIFPSAHTQSKLHVFKDLDASEETQYQDMFQKVVGA
jgi:spermidine/putrescine transport system substrate-binding protein